MPGRQKKAANRQLTVGDEAENAARGLGDKGHVVFINGIQSAGKTSVASEIRSLTVTFRVLTGDDVVREFPEEQRVRRWKEIFERLLARTEKWLENSNVIVDAALSAAQVEDARQRFGGSGLYVVLRIDEPERKRRESLRTDRKLPIWDPAWHSMPGPDDLYDHVIDSSRSSSTEAAENILAEAMERWPHPTV